MNQDKHSGFSFTHETPLPELGGTLYRLTHDKTGLELVWLKREEENKTFGIAFETLPWDDTGVFHILEHSVLCGSDRYPVKEPFVELMKSSMNTFLNAMTFPDKTFYPISSRNDKDFINLMRVYLDAVFCPLIYSKPEIFYQEGWHYELDEAGNASYKGVVFNEMKGAFADADRLVSQQLQSLLFPDSPYRFVSGGDPASIPDLSYETFVDSHRRFYAPSNAYVFLDGDLDLEQVLSILDEEYLSKYEKTERMAPPPMQHPVSGEAKCFYELAPGEEPEGKVRFAMGKVIGSFEEREKLIAVQVLAEVLGGTNQSPLCRAVLSEGLAEEVSVQVSDGVLQPWLVLDVKNLREENLEKIQTILTNQLKALSDGGLDHAQLEAVMANTEFKLRERDYGYYPQGIIFGFQTLESWLYGGDPAANLEVGDLFVHLKEKMAHGYFEDLIRQILLDNPHSASVVLYPSHTAGEERRAAEQARLNRETGAWTEQARKDVLARQQRLLAWQESQDTPQMLATIPQLELADIPAQPEQIPTEQMQIADIPVIVHRLHTGGIAYVSLYLDADSCTPEELSCLSFVSNLLGESDTARHSAAEIINKTRLLCGNFSVDPVTYTIDGEPNQMTVKLCVSFSALESNLHEALEHVLEVLTESRFHDETTHDILRQTKMNLFQRVVMAGNAVGLSRVTAQYLPAGVADEHTGSICFYQWMKQTDENWNFEQLNEKMTALLNRLISKTGMTISVSGAADRAVATVAQTLSDVLPAKPVLPKAQILPWGKRKEGVVIPADVSFAVLGGDLRANGGRPCGQMQLASQIISLGYLWNVIRVQGGAYGTSMVVRDTGLMACLSYRDPSGANSLVRYQESGAFLRQMAQQETDFTGFIIGAVANASPLMTPRTKAQAGDAFYFRKTTWQSRCDRRRELLNATAEDVLALADAIEQTLADGGICVVGGKEQLERCPQLDSILTL